MLVLHLFLTLLVLLLGLAAVGLNVLSLPGNWVMLLAAIMLSWSRGWPEASLWVLLIVGGILVVAEVVELVASLIGARTFGASKSAMVAALVGGLVGALIGVPVPLVGSILGA